MGFDDRYWIKSIGTIIQDTQYQSILSIIPRDSQFETGLKNTKNTCLADQILSFGGAWLACDEGLKRYDTLLRIAERESRAASSLATRLRITRQAVDHPTTAGRAITNTPTGRKPWNVS